MSDFRENLKKKHDISEEELNLIGMYGYDGHIETLSKEEFKSYLKEAISENENEGFTWLKDHKSQLLKIANR
jgi:hypothetical protein